LIDEQPFIVFLGLAYFKLYNLQNEAKILSSFNGHPAGEDARGLFHSAAEQGLDRWPSGPRASLSFRASWNFSARPPGEILTARAGRLAEPLPFLGQLLLKCLDLGVLARREERLAKLAEARAKLDERAKERFEREMAEHRAKLAGRDEKTAASGKNPGGRPPAPPLEGPQAKDQINLTDEDSRIMPVAGGGFEQCYNAQAVVATTVAPNFMGVSWGEPETPQLSPRPGRLIRSPYSGLPSPGALVGPSAPENAWAGPGQTGPKTHGRASPGRPTIGLPVQSGWARTSFVLHFAFGRAFVCATTPWYALAAQGHLEQFMTKEFQNDRTHATVALQAYLIRRCPWHAVVHQWTTGNAATVTPNTASRRHAAVALRARRRCVCEARGIGREATRIGRRGAAPSLTTEA
jgi:hypothetical protein